MKLHESKGGSLLATEELEAKDKLEVVRATRAASQKLLQKGLGTSTNVRSSTQAEGRIGGRSDDFVIENDDVVVAFDSEPPGATVLVDGELLCPTTPCRKQLRAGSREVQMSMERYASTRERFVAKADAAVKLTLTPKFARVQVDSTPTGITVTLDGKPAGKTPLTLEVDPGSREVLVGDECWVPEGERVNVAVGDARRMNVTLNPRLSAIKISAEDAKGNVVESEISVDRKRVGTSPGTFKVPVCSKEVVVVGPSGRRWSERLELREHQVTNVQATFGGKGRAVPGDTFVQPSTGLEWQYNPSPNEMNWAHAKAYCAGLSLDGNRWRLPTKDELLGLHKERNEFVAIAGMDGGGYWSSSLYVKNARNAWGVGYLGDSFSYGTGYGNRVRCVR